MKTKSLLIAAFSCVALIALFSCKKNSAKISHTPSSHLMAVNLAPDQAAVNFTVSGSNINAAPLIFRNYTGTYATVPVGMQDVVAMNAGTNTQLATASQTFADSAFYSVFLVGINNNYQNVLVNDNFDSLTLASGLAYIRYVNAITDSLQTQQTVSISSGGASIFDTAAAFASVSPFKGVAPGNITLNVNSETGVDTLSKSLSVTQGNVYTIVLAGEPAQADSTKAIQAILIQNGKLSH